MDKIAVVFSMRGCPFCVELKEMLEKDGIPFFDRDIHEHKEEYQMFVEVTGNDFVPSFMLIENPDTEPKTELYAPDRDFQNINEGFDIIKSFVKG